MFWEIKQTPDPTFPKLIGEISDVEWYDGPLLFTFIANEQRMLAVMIDRDYGIERFSVTPVTDDIWEKVNKKEIDLRTLIRKEKVGVMDLCGDKIVNYWQVPLEEMPEDAFPLENCYF